MTCGVVSDTNISSYQQINRKSKQVANTSKYGEICKAVLVGY